jgi:molecular chaperone GrpE
MNEEKELGTEETSPELNAASNTTEEVNIEANELEQLKVENAELKDKYLRLYSEFDNHKRRTAKERIELFKSAGEDLMSVLLPVLDDFERALKSVSAQSDVSAITEGIMLIHNKLYKTLENKGLKPMETNQGTAFDTELHEAITQFPAPSENLKGKIIDTAEKGYLLNEKVIRFAKVIVGS